MASVPRILFHACEHEVTFFEARDVLHRGALENERPGMCTISARSEIKVASRRKHCFITKHFTSNQLHKHFSAIFKISSASGR